MSRRTEKARERERQRLIAECREKASFHSERAARHEAWWRWAKLGHSLRPYSCRWCNGWHLTSDVAGPLEKSG